MSAPNPPTGPSIGQKLLEKEGWVDKDENVASGKAVGQNRNGLGFQEPSSIGRSMILEGDSFMNLLMKK